MELLCKDPLLTLFTRSVLQYPQHIAVEDGPQHTLTYQQLAEESTALARYLQAQGVQRGEIIPILTSTCVSMVVGILGIIQAGAIYVPVDRDRCPPGRIEYILRKTRVKTVLYTGAPVDVHPARAIALPVASDLLPREDDRPLGCRDSDLLAIIFTSGTTNRPKGVQIRSSSVARLVSSPDFNYNITAGERVLLVLSVGFDACMGTLFNTICNGGTLVLANSLNLADRAAQCNTLVATPSILAALGKPGSRQEYPRLSRIILGGESASQALLHSWAWLDISIWVAYGPTEATCAVLTGLLRPDPVTGIFSPQQLGQPIPGATVILLDESLKPVESDQVPGEICVAGPCLSAGYLDDVERTREKFIYIKHHAQVFYRTGDLGRWAHTGTGKRVVEFLGREDRTVKVRGFLVNLEQDVDQGIVQACPEVSAVYSLLLDSNFCAAFVTQKDIDPEEVLARWREVALPYTVPDHLFRLDAFPLNPNGKLDPNQLRDIVAARLQQRSACLTDMSLGLSLEELVVTWLQRELHLAASEVDLTRSCVALGVHSLAALNLSSACREKGYAVSVAEILTAPSLAQLLKQDRAPILRALSTNSSTIIAKAPATPLQHKFVLETRLEPSLNYAQHVVAYAAGDLPRIKAAWQQLVQIEPMFRTVFHEQGDHVIQEVMPVAEFLWQDVCSDPDSGFDLVATFAAQKTGVGARFLAVHGQDPREPTQVIWTVHRALLDGYSAALLFDKLDLILEGRPVEPSLPYTQAAVDLEQLQVSLETPSRVFYEQQQQRVPNPRGELLLPEPDVEGKLTARNEDYTVPRRINLARLQDAAQQANVTPAALLHAAWSLVVSSYSNSDQVLFGIVLAGRDLPFPWASSIVGPLMNQLPYRCEIPRKALVVEFLLSVQADLREYTRFQPTDGPGDPSPCATMLVVQPPGLKTAPTTIAPVQAAITHDATSVPLVVEVTASGDVRMIYRTDRFSSMAVREVGDMLLNLVTALSSDMQATVQQCLHHRLSPDIRQTLLERGNAHRPENQIRDEGETLSSLFRQVVRDHPQVTAVSKDQTRLTYRELAEAASRVAGVLEQLVRPGEVVAVLADRSINWIIGVWAVIIANAVYCPVDAAYSPSYQVDLVRRSTASLLLLPSSEHLAKRTPGSPRTIVTERVLLSQDPPILQWRPQSPADVAYICFTSGSTGVPKGVMCLHRGLVALQAVESVRLGSQPGRRIAQFLSPGFGGCVHEVFSALCYGGTLVLRKDDNDMLSHLHEVDTAIITPSVAAAMDAAHFPNLRQVYFGGEPVSDAIVRRWWSPGQRELYNIYGSTEATILNCQGQLVPGQRISLGGPVPSSRLYILDDHLDLVPPQTMGYIFIAGVQVSNGYINQSEQTARDFLPDPFAISGGQEKMYRTGDLGYFDERGRLFYCSRKDRQIKVRGYRVNLDDIAHAVHRTVPAAHKAVAVAQPQGIVLFVTPAAVDKDHIRKALHETLPPHAQPIQIQLLDQLPLSPNGKVDLKRLATVQEPTSAAEGPNGFRSVPASLSATQRIIADLWREVLHLSPSDQLVPGSDFFTLGGHSIAALQLASRLNARFAGRTTVRDILMAPTLEATASRVIQAGQLGSMPATSPTVPAPRLGLTALSPPERLYVHLYSQAPRSSALNVAYQACLSSAVNPERLAASVEMVLNHHRILRSRIHTLPSGTHERHIVDEPIRVQRDAVDVRAWANQPFHPGKEEPLVRVVVTPNNLLLNISHLLCDYDTLAVLLREISDAYQGRPLAPVVREYFDEDIWNQPVLPDIAAFWTEYLRGLTLPRWGQDQPSRSYRGASIDVPVPDTLGRQVLATRSFTVHQFGLAVTTMVLQTLGNTSDLVLGAAHPHRTDTGQQAVVGLHLEPLPLRMKIDDTASSVGEILREVAKCLQRAIAHFQPWHHLLAQLGLPFPSDHHELFDCAVTFHDQREESLALDIKGVTPVRVASEGAMFSVLFEWTCTLDRLSLRLQYDTDRFSPGFMFLIQQVATICVESMLDRALSRKSLQQTLRRSMQATCDEVGISSVTVQKIARQYLLGAAPGIAA